MLENLSAVLWKFLFSISVSMLYAGVLLVNFQKFGLVAELMV